MDKITLNEVDSEWTDNRMILTLNGADYEWLDSGDGWNKLATDRGDYLCKNGDLCYRKTGSLAVALIPHRGDIDGAVQGHYGILIAGESQKKQQINKIEGIVEIARIAMAICDAISAMFGTDKTGCLISHNGDRAGGSVTIDAMQAGEKIRVILSVEVDYHVSVHLKIGSELSYELISTIFLNRGYMTDDLADEYIGTESGFSGAFFSVLDAELEKHGVAPMPSSDTEKITLRGVDYEWLDAGNGTDKLAKNKGDTDAGRLFVWQNCAGGFDVMARLHDGELWHFVSVMQSSESLAMTKAATIKAVTVADEQRARPFNQRGDHPYNTV